MVMISRFLKVLCQKEKKLFVSIEGKDWSDLEEEAAKEDKERMREEVEYGQKGGQVPMHKPSSSSKHKVSSGSSHRNSKHAPPSKKARRF